jgi:hypothetical protein
VKGLVPEARSLRSHGLYQSSRLLTAIARDEELETDVSLFLPGHSHLQPVTLRLPAGTIVRVPYFWSDDHEMAQTDPAWSVEPLLAGPGLKVLNFHPVHVFLNAADTGPYAAVQAASPSLRQADRAVAERHAHSGPGTRTVFDEAVEHLRRAGGSATISTIARAHAAG